MAVVREHILSSECSRCWLAQDVRVSIGLAIPGSGKHQRYTRIANYLERQMPSAAISAADLPVPEGSA